VIFPADPNDGHGVAGFVSIVGAERDRQAAVVAEFRAKHGDVYDRAFKASIALKRALHDFEVARLEIADAAKDVAVTVVDVTDHIDRTIRDGHVVAVDSIVNGLRALDTISVSQAYTKAKRRAA